MAKMNGFRKISVYLWYLLGIFVGLAYVQGPLAEAFRDLSPLTWASAVSLIKAIVGLALIGGIFYFVHQVTRAYADSLKAAAPEGVPAKKRAAEQLAFPAPATVNIAAWLLFMSVVFLVGLFMALDSDTFLGSGEFRYLTITIFAAGIGSMITTILGYLKHASVDQDFDPAFSPWYIARPIMGVLLGVVFYFVLKGGLLATIPDAANVEINEFGLAGLGGLVGLFSKNAIEKLREIFNVLFRTEDAMTDEIISRLPEDLAGRVRDHLKS